MTLRGFLQFRSVPAIVGLCMVVATAQSFSAPVSSAHPDFTGTWVENNRGGPKSLPALTSAAQALYAKKRADIAKGDPNLDPVLRCMPGGFARLMMGILPIAFVQSAKTLAIIGEGGGKPRLIYIDGAHDPGMWPTFMGESVGRWDGDTLAVDTVKIHTDASLDADGLPHSDALHVSERIRLIKGGKTLEDQFVFDDSEMFMGPWIVTVTYDRRDDIRPIENDCDPKVRTRP